MDGKKFKIASWIEYILEFMTAAHFNEPLIQSPYSLIMKLNVKYIYSLI
jgi:hypothetical protein